MDYKKIVFDRSCFSLRIARLILPILVIATIWSLFYTHARLWDANYHPYDDFEVLEIEKHLLEVPLITEVGRTLSDDLNELGRFRPFYMALRVVETEIFGHNLFLWTLSVAFLTIAGSCFFYFALRIQKFNVIFTAFFIFMLYVGDQSPINWRLGTAETLGTFLIGLAVLLSTLSNSLPNFESGKNRLFIRTALVFTLTSLALTKESLLACVPALLVWDIWINNRVTKLSVLKIVKKQWFFLLINSLIILSIALTIIILIRMRPSETYSSAYGFTFTKFQTTFANFLVYGNGYLLIGAMITLAIFKIGSSEFRRKPNSHLFFAALIAIMILIPQFYIYVNSGMRERYLIPSIVGSLLLIITIGQFILDTWNADDTSKSTRLNTLSPFALIAIFLQPSALEIYNRYQGVFDTAEGFRVDGAHFGWLAKRVKQEVQSPDDPILVVGDPAWHFQWVISVQSILDVDLKLKNVTRLDASLDQPISNFDKKMIELYHRRYPKFIPSASSTGENYRVIIVVGGIESKLPEITPWFNKDAYTEEKISGFYVYIRRS